jgi:hypothetical protein
MATTIFPATAAATPDTTRLTATLTRARKIAWLVLATFAVIFIHGYHPYAEDAAIYLPAIEKQMDPTLFPQGADFFLAHARASVFSGLIAFSASLTHLSLDYVLLLWYALSVALLLTASWRFAELCFDRPRAGLYGALLVAAVMTIPVAGTSLMLADPYLAARSLSTPLFLFALCYVLEDKLLRAGGCLLLASLLHPLMGVYGCALAITVWAVGKAQWRLLAILAGASAVVVGLGAAYMRITGVSENYRTVVLTRSYLFLAKWAWYEIFGLIAPLGLFAALLWRRRAPEDARLRACAIAALLNGVFFLLIAMAVTRSVDSVGLVRFQPLRAFHLIYLLMFLLPIHYATQRIFSRRANLFYLFLIPVFTGMFIVQEHGFPASPHVEWPWTKWANPWREAFAWIRSNTPKDAIFALDPDYMDRPGEDRLGFRAYAERVSLADRSKDGGVAVLFPGLADAWVKQFTAAATLTRIASEPGAVETDRTGWMVVQNVSTADLDCPYRNRAVAVCRINPSRSNARTQASHPYAAVPRP